MIPTDSQKIVQIVQPQAIKDDADFAGSYGAANPVAVDTRGWRQLDIYVCLGATDIAMAELALYASDTAIGSSADDANYTAVTGYVFGTGTAPALPSSDADGNVYRLSVNKEKTNKRYFAVQAKAGNGSTGTFATVIAVLSRPEEHPSTAAERGLAAEILP